MAPQPSVSAVGCSRTRMRRSGFGRGLRAVRAGCTVDMLGPPDKVQAMAGGCYQHPPGLSHNGFGPFGPSSGETHISRPLPPFAHAHDGHRFASGLLGPGRPSIVKERLLLTTEVV